MNEISSGATDTKLCPYCAETIKAEAKVCRFCGRDLTGATPAGPSVVQQPAPAVKQKKGGGCLKTIGIIALILVGLAVAGSLLRPSTAQQAARTSATSTNATNAPDVAASSASDDAAGEQVTQVDAPVAASANTPISLRQIGEDVVLGDFRWKVSEAAGHEQLLKSPNSFTEDATTTGQFVRVMFDIENLGKERKSFLGVDLADAQGRTFGSYDNGFMYVDDDKRCIMMVLQPNMPQTCEVIFETPADATGLMLEITDGSMFASQSDYVELGQ